jgi:hypothetical protein
VPLAAGLADRPRDHTAALLEHLADVRLLDARDADRYRMHDLLRLFARERGHREESAEEHAQAVRRALRASIATARSGGVVPDRRMGRSAVAGTLEPRHGAGVAFLP